MTQPYKINAPQCIPARAPSRQPGAAGLSCQAAAGRFIDRVPFSGYRHRDEGDTFGQAHLPKLPLSHPIPRRDVHLNTSPFGTTVAGDPRPKPQAAE